MTLVPFHGRDGGARAGVGTSEAGADWGSHGTAPGTGALNTHTLDSLLPFSLVLAFEPLDVTTCRVAAP